MQPVHPPVPLPDPDATAALGRALAGRLGAGDAVLLQGGLGAGKTHLARALIQSLLLVPEDVPSPSFTLVQTYGAGNLEIWHADLYRLAAAEEVAELGLDAAFGAALVLVEWPDRLGPATPPQALTLRFADIPGGPDEARRVTLLPAGPRGAELAAHARADARADARPRG
jgi:tRNA threonylcarbamoyladenosine biosynthesis protein TsaE